MKHIKPVFIIFALLTLSACTDSTSSDSTVSSVETLDAPPVTSPETTTAAEPSDAPTPGGISIENSYNELQSVCTPMNSGDIYADFSDCGLEYFTLDRPDFSNYYNIPAELPSKVQQSIADGTAEPATPEQFYMRTVRAAYLNGCVYFVVQSADSTAKNLIIDLWEVPYPSEEPRIIHHFDEMPVNAESEWAFDLRVVVHGLSERYILYSAFSNSFSVSQNYVLNRSTGEVTALPENCSYPWLLGDDVYFYDNYPVTVLDSDYAIPVIYKYSLSTGKQSVFKFDATPLFVNSPCFAYQDTNQSNTIHLLNADGVIADYTPVENEMYYLNGCSIAVSELTATSEIFGSKIILGRRFNDIKQDFVMVDYKYRVSDVSFSDNHFMGFTLSEHLGSDGFNRRAFLYDKHGQRLMEVTPAEGSSYTYSDGSWIYYSDFDETKFVAVLCE